MPIKETCQPCPLIKRTTQLLIKQGNGYELPDWTMHPSWTAGVERLNAYNCWVSEVLLPIAFQWIEENKVQVYKGVPEELKDDVGVVIASAFEIVKTKSSYTKGVEEAVEFEKERERGEVDLKTINPVWADITRKVREDTKRIFDEKKDVLKGT
jgi:hypothetical protein